MVGNFLHWKSWTIQERAATRESRSSRRRSQSRTLAKNRKRSKSGERTGAGKGEQWRMGSGEWVGVRQEQWK